MSTTYVNKEDFLDYELESGEVFPDKIKAEKVWFKLVGKRDYMIMYDPMSLIHFYDEFKELYNR